MKNFYQSLLFALLLIGSSQAFAQVPVYNSFPGAPAVIFLDFDGHTVTGTSWNASGPIVCANANLSTPQITEVYNRIAEDYRPFNINVTTDSTKYLAAPATRRMRVLFTTSSSWYGSNAGGVAFVGSFTWGDNTPCFIFTALLNYNTKFISEAGAHEAGHTLGLRHQSTYNSSCVKTSDYNYGTGDASFGWAPIMGVGYYKKNTTWYNGPNPYGCSSYQSDFDIISTNSGYGLRSDDFGDGFAQAPAQSFVSNQFDAQGNITTAEDKDLFKFVLNSRQKVRMAANPTTAGVDDANLDIQLNLYNGQKNPINTYNPPLALNANVDTILDAGTYYFEVEGVGNQYTPDYGSLGSYSVLVEQAPLATLPLRKLELKGIREGNNHRLTWEIDADEAVVSQVLESSTNGRDFTAVAEPANDARSFTNLPSVSAVQYRLNVKFDNGKQHYSNIIALRSDIQNKPQLFTNIIRNNNLMVNSPSSFTYIVTDYNGRMIQKGMVTPGASTITLNTISSGGYIIRFTNETTQFVEKFVKQ